MDHKTKESARARLRYAVQTGRLARPKACSQCGARRRGVYGHHSDYSKALDVEWFCSVCHGLRHRKPRPCAHRTERVALAVTPSEKHAIRILAGHRKTTEADILRSMLMDQIVVEHDRLMSALETLERREEVA